MVKVRIRHSEGYETTSKINTEKYYNLLKWYKNPKACKTYVIQGGKFNDLFINKDTIIYMLAESVE
jgi:polysaccharide pyruvyl transferase WcaK-like protein